jgi:hypothetical protein
VQVRVIITAKRIRDRLKKAKTNQQMISLWQTIEQSWPCGAYNATAAIVVPAHNHGFNSPAEYLGEGRPGMQEMEIV